MFVTMTRIDCEYLYILLHLSMNIKLRLNMVEK